MPTLQEEVKELQGKVEDRQKKMHDIFAEAKTDDGGFDTSKITSIPGDDNAKIEGVRALQDELTELGESYDKKKQALDALLQAAESEGATEAPDDAKSVKPEEQKDVGQLFVESKAFEQRDVESELDIDLKTLFQTSAGWSPETTRSGRVVEDAQRPVQVTDMVPTIPSTQSAYTYMEETTFTSNAAEAAEGGAYGEAALALTEQSSTVRKIAVFLPMTDEQLEDVSGARAYVNQRLRFMARQRLDGQILVGDGMSPNLEGVNNVSGIQTQAKGTDPVPDAVYKAMRKVRVTGRAMPNSVTFHPNDWEDVRLLRTNEGIYIWGNPSEAGPERIWGRQVVQSDAQTENTAVVGDWENHSLLVVRRGIQVKVSDSHSDYFAKGKQAVRADMRVALVFLRPAAFATVTGI